MNKAIAAACVLILSSIAMPAAAAPGAEPAAAATQGQSPARAPTTRAGVLQTIETNFKRIDADGDGALSRTEIDTAKENARQRAAARIGQRFEQQFAKLDTNKDGQLSLAEFKAAAPEPKADDGDTEQALDRFDADNDGRVTQAEFSGPVLANFDRMDANKDGTLSAEERRTRRSAESR